MPPMRTKLPVLAIALAIALVGCSFHGESPLDAGTHTADARVDARPDAPPDAPTPILLRETETNVVVNGHTSFCLANASVNAPTQSEVYERTFPLTQFSITGDFRVNTVVFTANSATAKSVTVEVGIYAGSVGDPTLNPALMSWYATSLIDVPDGINQVVQVPITTTIPAGAVLLVGIAAPSYVGLGGTFAIAGTDGNQILPSYYTAPSCGTTTPSTRDSHNGSVGNFLIEVIGFVL